MPAAVSRGLLAKPGTSQGRVAPWTTAELNKHILESKDSKEN